jgi:hypothetical protein
MPVELHRGTRLYRPTIRPVEGSVTNTVVVVDTFQIYSITRDRKTIYANWLLDYPNSKTLTSISSGDVDVRTYFTSREGALDYIIKRLRKRKSDLLVELANVKEMLIYVKKERKVYETNSRVCRHVQALP